MSDFETVPVGTTAELERIKQERETLKAQKMKLRQELRDEYWRAQNAIRARDNAAAEYDSEIEELQRERDELAAYVERLHRALDNILHEVGTHSHDDLSDDERAALAALSETPSASLIRLKLIAKAELMDRLASGQAQAWDYIAMTELANDLRQQAEAQARSDCELECGAFGAYCKCKAEAQQ